MRRGLCFSFMVAMIFIFVTGCSIGGDQAKGKELLNTYLQNVEGYDEAVRQFGEPASHIYMDDTIGIGILYPETGVENLDTVMDSWITETVAYYKSMTKEDLDAVEEIELEDGETVEGKAELTVSYESYYAGEYMAGVCLTGTYVSPALAHPIDLVKTFNVNLETGEVISITDVMTKDGKSAMKHMLMIQTGVEESDIDEGIFDHGVLTDCGIKVVLNRGDYLPMSEGTKTAFFSYSDVKSMVTEDFTGKRKIEEKGAKEDDAVETSAPLEKRVIDPDKPMIALTFDDGPSAHTERLLDIFAKHGGKGTFFVLGNLIDGREETLQKMSAEGHEVAGHSWNHRQLTNLTEDGVKDQIMMTRAKIFAATGKDSLVVRAPYGACDEMVLGVGKELGVTFYNWSVDTLDWLTKDPKAIEKEIMSNVSDGDIILCHDLHGTTVDAMERVIPKLIKKGYQLVTVSELMLYSDQKVEAGKLYLHQ